jgi:hypothetical protein
MIPRKKGFLLLIVKNIPVTPRSIIIVEVFGAAAFLGQIGGLVKCAKDFVGFQYVVGKIPEMQKKEEILLAAKQDIYFNYQLYEGVETLLRL